MGSIRGSSWHPSASIHESAEAAGTRGQLLGIGYRLAPFGLKSACEWSRSNCEDKRLLAFHLSPGTDGQMGHEDP